MPEVSNSMVNDQPLATPGVRDLDPAEIIAEAAKRWRLVEELFHASLAVPEPYRQPYLALACAGDAKLQGEVDSLLAFDQFNHDGILSVATDRSAANDRSAASNRRDTPRPLAVLVDRAEHALAKVPEHAAVTRVGFPAGYQSGGFFYRLRRQWSRHRLAFSAAAILLVSWLAGTLMMVRELRSARQREEQVSRLAAALLTDLPEQSAGSVTDERAPKDAESLMTSLDIETLRLELEARERRLAEFAHTESRLAALAQQWLELVPASPARAYLAYSDLGRLNERIGNSDQARRWYGKSLEGWHAMQEQKILPASRAQEPERVARLLQALNAHPNLRPIPARP